MLDYPPNTPSERLHLAKVTLCAISCVNVEATLWAIEASLRQIRFGACKLFTDIDLVTAVPAIEIVRIDRLRSSQQYSEFVLAQLPDHIATSHCLIVQWDGHVLNARHWQPAFLEYDYIGAPWPQFHDGHDVGNGGFSLRTRRLMDACRDPGFNSFHPEDLAIGRGNRRWLEERGMRFAGAKLAGLFSTERSGQLDRSFGYHGVFNMPRAVGTSRFWAIYSSLDDRNSVYHDFVLIAGAILSGKHGVWRVTLMIAHRTGDFLRRLLVRANPR